MTLDTITYLTLDPRVTETCKMTLDIRVTLDTMVTEDTRVTIYIRACNFFLTLENKAGRPQH